MIVSIFDVFTGLIAGLEFIGVIICSAIIIEITVYKLKKGIYRDE